MAKSYKIVKIDKKEKTAHEKRQRNNRIFSAIMGLIFIGSTFAAFAVPMITSRNQEDSIQEQKELIEALQKQQEEEIANREVDPTFVIDGEVTELQIIDSVTGDGQELKLGDTIVVKYKGGFAADGQIFETNDVGVEFSLEVGSLITGWTDGLPGMRVGGIRRLVIPSDLAYGTTGSASIPANTDLVFDVELVEIK